MTSHPGWIQFHDSIIYFMRGHIINIFFFPFHPFPNQKWDMEKKQRKEQSKMVQRQHWIFCSNEISNSLMITHFFVSPIPSSPCRFLCRLNLFLCHPFPLKWGMEEVNYQMREKRAWCFLFKKGFSDLFSFLIAFTLFSQVDFPPLKLIIKGNIMFICKLSYAL